MAVPREWPYRVEEGAAHPGAREQGMTDEQRTRMHQAQEAAALAGLVVWAARLVGRYVRDNRHLDALSVAAAARAIIAAMHTRTMEAPPPLAANRQLSRMYPYNHPHEIGEA